MRGKIVKMNTTTMRAATVKVHVFIVISICTCILIGYNQHILTRLPVSVSPIVRGLSQRLAHNTSDDENIPMTSDNRLLNVTKKDSNQSCSESYKRNHWIATRGIGRNGNLMFQLATVLATAKATCRTPAVTTAINKTLGQMFDLSKFAKIDFIRQTKSWHRRREKCRFSPELLQIHPAFNWTIWGYLNSWKYFQSQSDYVKSVFTFHKTILDTARTFLSRDDIVQNCPLTKSLRIGIHIRRGDFLRRRLYKAGHRVVNVEYTIMAREYFKKLFPDTVLCFIVVSNDIRWCKKNIRDDNIFYSTLKTPGEDMALLSLCNHTIVSTGTFGWFGAWLAGGQVVYYSGFPRRESEICPSNGADFIPPGWVGLP